MIQAFIDESISEGQVLILGGLLATAEQWEKFSDEWQWRLDCAPWSRFKMSEVWNRGGDISLEKAKWHYFTLKKYVPAAIAMVVPIAVLQQAVAGYQATVSYEVSAFLKNPYVWGVKALIEAMLQNQHRWGLSEPIDLVFDSRSEEDQIRTGWRMYEVFPPNVDRSLVGRKPIFADDEKVLPLQAADMWVWWCRKKWLESNSFVQSAGFPIPWGDWSDMGVLMFELTEDRIKRELSIMRAGLEAAGFS
jgi:hypothetical protein